jgi:hypothetical protein
MIIPSSLRARARDPPRKCVSAIDCRNNLVAGIKGKPGPSRNQRAEECCGAQGRSLRAYSTRIRGRCEAGAERALRGGRRPYKVASARQVGVLRGGRRLTRIDLRKSFCMSSRLWSRGRLVAPSVAPNSCRARKRSRPQKERGHGHHGRPSTEVTASFNQFLPV